MRRALVLPFALAGALGCSDSLELGSDLIWTADHETGTLDQWLGDGQGQASTPRTPDTEENGNTPAMPGELSRIEISGEQAHRGRYAVKLVNPTGWEQDFDGPELLHYLGPLGTAYYSAWFYLPEQYRLEPHLTLLRLRSRDPEGDELFNGEELQLRSLPTGGYVLQVFSNNNNFLLEPIADPAPHVESGRWFQLEARFEPPSSGHLRVWLDGTLVYDLGGRPGAAGSDLVLAVCNVAQSSDPAPVIVYVDDAAVSRSRVSPTGQL